MPMDMYAATNNISAPKDWNNTERNYLMHYCLSMKSNGKGTNEIGADEFYFEECLWFYTYSERQK